MRKHVCAECGVEVCAWYSKLWSKVILCYDHWVERYGESEGC